MKNFSLRKATLLLLLLTAAEHVSASVEMRIPHLPEHYQNQIIGTVTDANGPLPAVTVTVKGRAIQTITDVSGRFTIAANLNDVIVFTYVGYATQELMLTDYNPLNVSLVPDETNLNEVTVNAGYYSVKERERTGSISKITAKDLETQPVTNVLATMQGRMAGVNITQTTGVPGGGFNIQIRGQNSLRTDGNAPLYIIDGVPYSSDPIGSNFTSNIFTSSTSPLNGINPDAIESIEVLKDADATAIYGSRGANGVVLITTKKGKAGKTKISIGASTGVGHVTRFMDLMNTKQYLAMRDQAFISDGIAPSEFDYDVNGAWDRNRNTDWQKEFIGGMAEFRELQGTVSGGTDRTQFLVGGNVTTQTTTFPGDFAYRKGGGNISLNHRSEDDRFRINVTANYVSQNNNLPAFDFTVESRSLAPNAPALYDENGDLNWENGTFVNPLRNLYQQYKSRTNDFVANGTVSYKLLPSLEAKLSSGYTNLRHLETRTSPSTIYNPDWGIGPEYSALFVSGTDRRSWIAEPQLLYERQLFDGRFSALVGGSFQQTVSNRLTQYGTGFTSNSLIYNLAAASTKEVALSDETHYNYQAFFGRINYNWKKRYIVNLTGRRDGSSRFGPGNQYATFGAVGAAWIFSNETFFKENRVLSFGKLRASYGTSGSDQIGDYQFLDTYSSNGGIYQGVVGLEPTRLYNPDFGWEVNKKFEASVEIGFLQDKIFVTAGYYRNRSSNQLVGIPLPATTGFNTLQANLGATVQNTGWEFTLRTSNIKSKDLSWTTSANLTLPKNELVSFPGLEGSSYKEKYRIGQPLNIFLAYHYTGVDPQTGLYQFEDMNGDGQITAPEDKQKAIDLNPKFFGGLQNQLSCKRWSLDFLFQFVKQKNFAYTMGNAGTMSNQPTRLVNSWQQPGDIAQFQVLTTGVNSAAVLSQSQYDGSDAIVTDASYLRLKNISLAYDLPVKLLSTQCKLYVQAQNLLTITPYKDGDPEFSIVGYLPPLRIVTAGVQLNF